jgi:hypothetical protein
LSADLKKRAPRRGHADATFSWLWNTDSKAAGAWALPTALPSSPHTVAVSVRHPSYRPLLAQSGHCHRVERLLELVLSRPTKTGQATRGADMSPFNIGFVIFPDVTQLDFTGPLQLLSRLPQSAIRVVAKSASPVPSDCGLGLLPTHTFANCPSLDLICIPGGSEGVAGIINDRETIEFVRQQASTAKYVTSVCTGAFVLGVAGLLKGRRATTHWAYTVIFCPSSELYTKRQEW